VVPQGQDVIPRRPRDGASCKDVIPRRPRGGASLLGVNSTISWWCLIFRIRIVKSRSVKWFGISCVDVCYLCLILKLHVECYDIRISFASLPFCLLVCLCLVFLLCDDHQFLMMIGMLQLDGHGWVSGSLWSL